MKESKHKQLEKKAVEKSPPVVAAKALGTAPDEKAFGLKDGRKLHTLYELVDELETMNDGVFRDYVNDMKNDFANWIEGVFGDKNLGAELRKIKSRTETQRALLKHLVRDLRRSA
ncbi:MAG TPA: hypothetical protein VLJ21_03700 [Candidatus Binatia bacterium]|nr:hypothetical protein [Candidatus Binatia bacterium]